LEAALSPFLKSLRFAIAGFAGKPFDCTKKMQGTRPCNLNASDLFPVSGGSE
jgi:hypothetical protein